MAQVIDYSWARPSTDGFVGVMRYLARQADAKRLSPAEADELRSRGLIVGVVWETTASRANEGHGAGVSDAAEAVRQADACGCHGAIYFAVDYDELNPSVVEPYFRGAATVLPVSRIGAYGSARVVSYLLDVGAITYAWQTIAWSGGKREGRAHLYQRVFAGDYDANDVLRDDWHGEGAIAPEDTRSSFAMVITRMHDQPHTVLLDGANSARHLETGEDVANWQWELARVGVKNVSVGTLNDGGRKGFCASLVKSGYPNAFAKVIAGIK